MLAYEKSAAINTFPNLTFESDERNFHASEDIENPSTEKHLTQVRSKQLLMTLSFVLFSMFQD